MEPHDPRPVSGPAVTRVRAESDMIGGRGGLALKNRGETGILVPGSSDLLPSQLSCLFNVLGSAAPQVRLHQSANLECLKRVAVISLGT